MVFISEKRIATVVEEINYWKEHNLLPDVYCDFLIALYTNGEGIAKEDADIKDRITLVNAIQFTLLLLLLPFSFLVIYFTEFNNLLQTSILLLFVAFSYWVSRVYSKKESIYYHLSLVTTLLLVLLTSVFISTWLNVNQLFLQFVLLLNVTSWYFLSRRNGIKYLKFISIFGMLFAILYIVLQKFHILSL